MAWDLRDAAHSTALRPLQCSSSDGAGGDVRKQAIVLGLALAAALAVALLTWRPLDEGEPLRLGADTAASFDASSERLSQKLQDSLERSFEAKLAELPNRFQDASDASSRLRSAQRTLDGLEDTPENAGVRDSLQHEIAEERARIEAAGVSAPPE
jgi:hypothetical protein